MTIFLLVLGLILFIGLVVVHELGHFLTARRNGVEVEEFGIGFPPRAKVLGRKDGTVYTLNWLPLGGFVRLKGEHDADQKPGTFGAASLWAKVKIMLAGVVMNLLTAVVLLTILALFGMPQLITKANQGEDQFSVASNRQTVTKQLLISYVQPDSPADRAGLQSMDELQSISADGKTAKVTSQEELLQATSANAGKEVVVAYTRDGADKTATVQLRSAEEVEASKKTSEPKGFLGISPVNYQVDRYTWAAPVVAVGTTVQLTKLTFQGLGSALAGLGRLIAGLVTFNTPARQAGQVQATEQISGPVGIFFIMQAGAEQGVGMVVFIIAIISLTLAIMNVLPIPALDGGRLFVTLLFRALRRPLTKNLEETIHGTGFALLMLLFLLITIVDVERFF